MPENRSTATTASAPRQRPGFVVQPLLARLRAVAAPLRRWSGRTTAPFQAPPNAWLEDLERLVREGDLDGAVAQFLESYDPASKRGRAALLQSLRSNTSPPNRYVGLVLLERVSKHYPEDMDTQAQALFATIQILRNLRRFTDVVALADRIAAEPAIHRHLEEWQRALVETLAVYALSRLGDYEGASQRHAALLEQFPTSTAVEEGIRLHAARDPEHTVRIGETRGAAKLRRRAFYLYMSALDRLSLDEEHTQALAATENKKERSGSLLLHANKAIRDGDNDRYERYMMSYFAKWNIKLPSIEINQTTLPVRAEYYDYTKKRKKGRPMLSVIMTTFNSAIHLPHSVGSILAQTFEDFELLIVDDCSSDGGETVAAAEAWAARDPRVRVLAQTENRGTYQSKNIGIEQAQGRFITCHDSDDFALPERFAQETRRLVVDPKLMAVQSAWIRLTPAGRVVLMRWGAFLHENPASVMVRREAVDRIGLFDGARTGADTEFRERLRLFFGTRSFGYIDKPLTIGLYREDSLTQQGAAGFDEDLASPERTAYWQAWTDWHMDCVRRGAIDHDLPLRATRLPIITGD